MRPSILRVALCFLMVWLLAATLGCRRSQKVNNVYSFNPDEGGELATAQGLFFGMSVDDRVNTELGDDVDWRYMLVTEPGELSVRLHIDNPEMMGNWYVRDSIGRVVHFQRLDPREGFYEAVDIPVEPGRYFFHIEAIKGSSIYTVQSQFLRRPRSIADVPSPRTVPRQTIKEQPKEPERIQIPPPRKKRRRRAKPPAPLPDKPTPMAERKVIATYAGGITSATQDSPKSIKVSLQMDTPITGIQDFSSDRVRGVVTQTKGELRGTRLGFRLTECGERVCYGVIFSDKTAINAPNVGVGDVRVRIDVYEGP